MELYTRGIVLYTFHFTDCCHVCSILISVASINLLWWATGCIYYLNFFLWCIVLSFFCVCAQRENEPLKVCVCVYREKTSCWTQTIVDDIFNMVLVTFASSYSRSQDCTIKVWETTQGKLIRELKVKSITFDYCGTIQLLRCMCCDFVLLFITCIVYSVRLVCAWWVFYISLRSLWSFLSIYIWSRKEIFWLLKCEACDILSFVFVVHSDMWSIFEHLCISF